MYKTVKLVLIILVVLCLNIGCSLLIRNPVVRNPVVRNPVVRKEYTLAEINDLLARHQYGVALTALETIKNRGSGLEMLRKQTLAKAKDYTTEQIAQSRRLFQQGQVFQASEILNDSLGNLPDSKALQDESTLLTARRDELVLQQRNGLTLDYAHYLKEALDVHRQIAIWQFGSEQLSLEYINTRNEVDKLVKNLLEIGLNNLEKEEISIAGEYYKAALKLSNGEEVKIAYRRYVKYEILRKREIEKTQDKKKRKKQLQIEKANAKKKREKQFRAERLQEKIKFFQQSIRKKNMNDARKSLNAINRLSANTERKKSLNSQYQSVLNEEIQNRYQQGVRYYSGEQYKLALKAWQRTLELDPEHELARQNVQRVSRILEKLKQLRAKDN